MIRKTLPQWIVVFGDHWGPCNMGSPGNITLEFNNVGFKILWINPIPKTNLTLSKTHGNKQVFVKRIINKIKVHARIFSRVNNSFFVLTPIYWPSVEGRHAIIINSLLYKLQIKLVMFFLRIKSYSICNYTSNNIIKYLNIGKHSFFHIAADMHSDLRTANNSQRELILANERTIFRQAEKIFAASENIKNRVIELHGFSEKLVVLPHGVDYKHFADMPEVRHLSGLPRPIVGYFGSLTFTNDLDIFEEIAKSGYTFVLIGQVLGDYSRLRKYANVYFIGPKPYKDLPSYAFDFDVCVMAWKPSSWIQNSNPKKTLEYLALGKPVVSIKIPQIELQFGDLIYFADDPQQFVNQIERALKEDSNELRMKRMQTAAKNDWSKTVKIIIESLGWS